MGWVRRSDCFGVKKKLCIIIYKPCESKPPTPRVLETCAGAHKDGFGLMYRIGEKIVIMKGTYDIGQIKLIASKVPEGAEAAYHFRLATHGTICPENCHPFPLTHHIDALRATYGVFDSGIVHNGIVYGLGSRSYGINCESPLSDTMHLVRYISIKSKGRATWETLQNHIKSHYGKFIVFLPEWTLRFGDFVEEGGLKYSNTSYKSYVSHTVEKSKKVSPLKVKTLVPVNSGYDRVGGYYIFYAGKKYYYERSAAGDFIIYRGVTIDATDCETVADVRELMMDIDSDEVRSSLITGKRGKPISIP